MNKLFGIAKLNCNKCKFSKTSFSTQQLNNSHKVLTKDNIFENVLKVEYAVRGPIVVRAGEIENELKKVVLFEVLLL